MSKYYGQAKWNPEDKHYDIRILDENDDVVHEMYRTHEDYVALAIADKIEELEIKDASTKQYEDWTTVDHSTAYEFHTEESFL